MTATRLREPTVTTGRFGALRRTANDNRWAVILAGGDGTRLRSLTRAIAGDDRPKQFCEILGKQTLLDQTRRRVGLSVKPEQTLMVVTETHKEFYTPLVSDVAAANLVVQPNNASGTTPAIVYSLMRLAKHDPNAIVAFFPSDHYFANDATFMSHVESAFRAVKSRPELIVLLGIEPDKAETEYGWIEPARSIFNSFPRAISRVEKFWEKPAPAQAQKLMAQGFLWNSFVMVGRVDAFLRTIQQAVPEIYGSFTSIQKSIGATSEPWAIRGLYSELEPSNFSRDVLGARANDLAVMPVKDVGWSDWGDPGRVLSTLARLGVQAAWAQAAS